MRAPVWRAPATMLREFFRLEAAGGIMLLIAAAVAIIMRNSPAAPLYDAFQEHRLTLGIDSASLTKPLILWINDGLMAIFFLLVGLEIKREIVQGQLSSRDQIILPMVAALGGMVVPAIIYVLFNHQDASAVHGWAIPSATDIAFAICIFSLAGKGTPLTLKVLLTAIAVVDDMGAIIIIALFYTAKLSMGYLLGAVVCMVVLAALNRFYPKRLWPFLLVGAAMWVFVLKSGLHATIAGVVTALFIPLRLPRRADVSPLETLEHALHPWVAFAILPIFAFANAGLDLRGLSLADLAAPIPMGITAGLVAGKQIGVFGACWLMIKAGWVRMPDGANWTGLYGMSVICGIGFTMSLFIGGLAFPGGLHADDIRLGILTGSLISALGGLALLRLAARQR